MPVVLVSCPLMKETDEVPMRILQEAGFEVRFRYYDRSRTDQDVIELLRGVEVIVAALEHFHTAVFEALPDLRLIVRCGVGYDQISVPDATRAGVPVCVTPGANHFAVSDYAFALMLAVARRVVENDELARAARWERRIGVDVWQKTLGIVGLGRIGQGTALRAKGFDMRVLAYEPYPDRDFVARHGIELVSLEELLRESDFVTIHCPSTPETRHLINERTLGLMKPTAYVINTARGAMIDEKALHRALVEGRIAGAGLDVFEVEPMRENMFKDLPNVVMAPHVAGMSEESLALTSKMNAEQIVDAFAGRMPQGILNPEVWPGRFAQTRV